jgi:hypothetical protein
MDVIMAHVVLTGSGVVSQPIYRCLTIETLRHEDMWGNGCTDLCLLGLSSSRRLVVSFMSLQHYPGEEALGTLRTLGYWWDLQLIPTI